MNIFKLFGTIAINNTEANRSIDETGEKGEKTHGKLKGAFSKIGSAALECGKVIAKGLAVGTAAFAGLAVKALEAGGELEQNMGGSEAVFGEHAKGMQEAASEAYAKMGLSASDYLATANKMGSLLKGSGYEAAEAADLTSVAMQRAADVASIMGIDTASAMESIAGACKGNFTMMDNLGVAINDTTLANYALEKGITKSTSEMTTQEKVGLAMELFLEKTSDYAENYAKENETLAGSLNTAKAALSNFLSGAGDVDAVVDSFSNAADVIAGNLVELLPRLTEGLTSLCQKLIPKIPPLLETLLPACISGAQSLISGLVSVIPDLIPMLTSAIPAFIDAIIAVATTIVEQLPVIIQAICDALPDLIPQLVNGAVQLFVLLCENIGLIIEPLVQALPGALDILVRTLWENLPVLIQAVIDLYGSILSALWELLGGLWNDLCGWCSDLWGSIGEIWAGVATWFDENVIQPVANFFAGLWDSVSGFFSGLWEDIKGIWGAVANWFNTTIIQPIVGFFSGLWNSLKTGAANAWNGIKSVFSSVANWFKDIFSKAWQKVKDVFSTGGKIFDGIKEGIVTAFKTVVNAIIKGINKVIEVPFNAINAVLQKIHDINILGVSPFTWIHTFQVPQIPLLARGGVVDEPTTAMFGEDGAEAVVPLENNTGWLNEIASRLATLEAAEENDGTAALIAKIDEVLPTPVSPQNEEMISLLSLILERLKKIDGELARKLEDALSSMRFEINNREFARLVKAV